MVTATTFAELRRSDAFSCGARATQVTGRGRPHRLKALKLLIASQLTPISQLVTYREDCPVRYKITVWRKTQRLWGLSPWSRAVRYKRTLRPPPANCYFEAGTFWAASARPQRKSTCLHHDQQTPPAARSAASHSPKLQLGGPSLGSPPVPAPRRPQCLGSLPIPAHRRRCPGTELLLRPGHRSAFENGFGSIVRRPPAIGASRSPRLPKTSLSSPGFAG